MTPPSINTRASTKDNKQNDKKAYTPPTLTQLDPHTNINSGPSTSVVENTNGHQPS